jgi:hypothetical protein
MHLDPVIQITGIVRNRYRQSILVVVNLEPKVDNN